jgi:transglutaminase-like putative cysteine protease
MSGGIEGIGSMNRSGGQDPVRSRIPGPEPTGDSLLAALSQPPVAGILLAAAAFVSVFYYITDVVGGAGFLLMEVAAVVVLGLLAAGSINERLAVGITLVAFVLALLGYFFSVPESQRALFTLGRVGKDMLALASGLSVLRLINVGTWAVVLVPVPTFIVTYLTARRHYVWAVTIASAATGFFVLTGDAGPGVTLAAAVGGALTLGFSGLSAVGLRGVEAQWDTLAVIVAAMIVVTSLVTVVPGSATNPVVPGGQSPSVESSLVTNSDRVSVLGSISLSPKVRFVVQSEEPSYWRVGSYDRYTGNGWVRTGDTRNVGSRLPGPPGDSVEFEQRYRTRTKFDAIPAAWKPVDIGGKTAQIAQVTANGGLVPSTALQKNETYTITSERPDYTTSELRRAGTNYPSSIQQRYTQLPSSTPDRVRERTQRVLAQADARTPYDAAVAVEQYLESTKEYSLDVPNPSGNIADTFLFEMDSGYCTYYATTMVTMLRSQGIPARFVTGYTTGQRVGPEEYVVRGLDSHAWVEVYFPDVGWVRFDPTPSAERADAEQSTLDEARAAGESNIDAEGSEDGTYTTPPPTFTDAPDDTQGNFTETPPGLGQIAPQDEFGTANVTAEGNPFEEGFRGTTTAPGGEGGDGDGDGDDGGGLPSQRDAVLGVALFIGAVAGARRLGLTTRAYRFAWLVYQPEESDPDAAAERAYRRLEYLASRRYRPRAPGETPRQYVDALTRRGLDGEAETVARIFERAHYGDGVSAAEAETAISTVNGFVRDGLPVLRRFGS